MSKKSLLNPDDFITTKETSQQPERQAEYRNIQNVQPEMPQQVAPQYQQGTAQYKNTYDDQPARRGRKPKEEKNAREFLSIDLGGQKRNLKILCFDLEQQTGESWSLNKYIKDLIDEDIRSKQHIIDSYRNR